MKIKYVFFFFFSVFYLNVWLIFLIEDFIVCDFVCLFDIFYIDWGLNCVKDLFKDDFV